MAIKWDEVIALFGGTFDPPHLGHREAVRGLFKNPGVKRVWVLPSGLPPHKPGATPAQHRLAMAKLCFSPQIGMPYPSDVEVRTLELDRAARTGARTFSYDTLQELRRETQKLAFVIGADQLISLPTWHRFPEVMGLCHWIVLGRQPDGLDQAHTAVKPLEAAGLITRIQDNQWRINSAQSEAYLTVVPTSAPAASGTFIREQIAKTGIAPENLLSPAITAYLKHNALYGSTGTQSNEPKN